MQKQITPLSKNQPASISPLPTVSVVIETYNEETGPVLEIEQVLAGLAGQSYPADKIDILVAVDSANEALKQRLLEGHPDIEVFQTENSTYYSMKIEGINRARGDIIVMLDSDCLPVPGWAEAIARSISSGADVVAGKTRYVKGAPWSKTFDFWNFGYVQADASGIANTFLPNNVAFRREVILKHNFNPSIRRSGAAHLLCGQLKNLGYRVDYNPGMQVAHNAYGAAEEVRMRIKAGYDTVNLAGLDDGLDLEETRFVRSNRLLGLARVCIRGLVFDLRALFRNRQDLGLSFYHVPYFLLVSPLFRLLEFSSAVITVIKPDYFRKKFDW